MPKKSLIYWYCQLFGWFFYILTNSIYFGLVYNTSYKSYIVFFFSLLIGIGISHFYRFLIIKLKILEFKIPSQLLAIASFSFVNGVFFFLLTNLIMLSLDLIKESDITLVFFYQTSVTFTTIFCFWSFIYFGFYYFQNYRRAEINSLRYMAASRESELKSLKAQLNPHFIFNCMNSIRALIDENPVNAKSAVTQLSNILRNTLMMDKSKEIFLKDEINLVTDYLNLEKIRYEERLWFQFDIQPEVLNCRIPPFIIQSQVENAIKHGISINPGAGKIFIRAGRSNSVLNIQVSNTGKLSTEAPLTGVGFTNSKQRLELLYGKEGKIMIAEKEDLVIVDINIPLDLQ